MPSNPKNTVSTVIPAMRYRDANAAIERLCKAFGFERGVGFIPASIPRAICGVSGTYDPWL
jgi:hypothetical protein